MIVFEKNSHSHTRSFNYIENFMLFLGNTAKVTILPIVMARFGKISCFSTAKMLQKAIFQALRIACSKFCGTAFLASYLYIWVSDVVCIKCGSMWVGICNRR
jgi:hypothetical protein